MSFRKRDHIWSREKVVELEQEITTKIAGALRQKFRKSSTAVKSIANETGGALATVKKWYEGRNPPSLGHFLMLCRHYDEILKAFLNLSGNGYLIAFIRSKDVSEPILPDHEAGGISVENDPENVTINVTIRSLNKRQRWFLDKVRHRITPTIEEFVDRWNMTKRTARRDISELLHRNLIKRVGSKKNGRYEVV